MKDKKISRRNFIKLGGLAGAGFVLVPFVSSCGGDDSGNGDPNKPIDPGTGAKVGDVLPAWQEGYLDIHAINTGRGESTFYIFPDGTTMMVDVAGSLLPTTEAIPPTDAKPNKSITSGQVIVNYANHFMNGVNDRLNYLMLTHWDPDHMGNYSTDTPLSASGDFRINGITEVGTKLRFDKMIDRDYPTYNFPGTTTAAAAKANYRKFTDWAKTAYGATIEKFDVGKTDQIVLKKNPSKYSGFQIRNIMGNGWVWTGNGTESVNTLPSNAASIVAADADENVFSLAFLLSYGKFNYFAGGDLQFNGKSTYAWKDVEAPIINVVPAVDVMKANHHGTSNCNGEAFLKKLNPSVVLCHVWRDVQPNPDTIGRMYAANTGCRIFTTNMTNDNKTRLSAYLSKFYSTQGHVVVRVEPQGLKYTVYVLDDTNEEYKIKQINGPYPSN
ncbi:MAG: twin-arginine translocation signal domain-containing protein [Candidatus Symbiothrix sp.]|jgi:beta-lactamase superfamily II metal-dependent hydrolase|nr:twin-arginine translocation signal domain-containing protein [Candidatus Symbiothrix sp.]